MTDSEGGRILVQRAVQNPSSKKATQTSVKARRTALPQFLPVWFDVRVRSEQRDVQQLQAGESYTLIITGSLNRSSQHTEGIIITDGIKLHPRCVLDVDAPLKLDLDGESFSLSYEEAAHFKEEFTISIPAKFPFCHLILGLSYTLPGAYLEELGECRVPTIQKTGNCWKLPRSKPGCQNMWLSWWSIQILVRLLCRRIHLNYEAGVTGESSWKRWLGLEQS